MRSRAWWPRLPELLLGGLAVLAGALWAVLGVVVPEGGVLMIGSLDSGRARIMLVAAAVALALWSAIVALIRLADRSGDVVALLCWSATGLCVLGWLGTWAVCGLESAFEPRYQRLDVPSGGPAVVLRLYELQAADDGFVGVTVLVGDGPVLAPLDVQAPDADAAQGVAPEWVVERTQADLILRYTAAGGRTVAVPITGG